MSLSGFLVIFEGFLKRWRSSTSLRIPRWRSPWHLVNNRLHLWWWWRLPSEKIRLVSPLGQDHHESIILLNSALAAGVWLTPQDGFLQGYCSATLSPASRWSPTTHWLHPSMAKCSPQCPCVLGGTFPGRICYCPPR